MNFNRFFVKNYQFTLIIFAAVLLLGLNSLFNMPRSEDPPFGAPMFSIVGVYPGTSPRDMEELVVDPIEEELYKLEDIKKIESTIRDGLLVMLVEFNYGVNVDNKNNDVIREINKLRRDLPDGLIRLDVKRAASSDVAILQTALVSETASMEELNRYAEQLEKNIERIRDIKWVDIQGVPDQLVKIEIDLEKMAQLNLGLNQVLGLIEANNVNIPGGDIDLGARTYNIKTQSEYRNLADIQNTVISSSSTGNITHLRDIANVYMSEENTDHLARFNGRRAIWVVSAMKDQRNIIEVRNQMEDILQSFEQQLPPSIEMEQAFDQEKGVKLRLAGLGRDFAIAIFL
ncbi:MAG: efflux RND transporter permease subunit, partial [Saprospiraceae bacterium]|nr:efflux RND transporter permease subunit [Saprospiraceae bacterium]